MDDILVHVVGLNVYIRGGSRGRVQGVRTPPPWGEAFVYIYTYSLLIFFYLTVSDVIP